MKCDVLKLFCACIVWSYICICMTLPVSGQDSSCMGLIILYCTIIYWSWSERMNDETQCSFFIIIFFFFTRCQMKWNVSCKHFISKVRRTKTELRNGRAYTAVIPLASLPTYTYSDSLVLNLAIYRITFTSYPWLFSAWCPKRLATRSWSRLSVQTSCSWVFQEAYVCLQRLHPCRNRHGEGRHLERPRELRLHRFHGIYRTLMRDGPPTAEGAESRGPYSKHTGI